ncbi:MAG: type III pantothenate kinase [Chitinophagaceae bacterium]
MYTICFDLGNTRRKYAVFCEENLEVTDSIEGDLVFGTKELLERYKPDKSILSSVINHDPELEKLLADHTNFHKLTATSRLNFVSVVTKPETVGADRLALMAASVSLYPDSNVLAIGLGTCITYNFVNKYGQFLGGGISPGMDMRFRSLQELTAMLPLVRENWNFPLVGYDTETNILSGVILGMAKEIDGFIDEYAKKYENFNAVLTGGNSTYFVPYLKKQIFADPNLIFKGLYAISECN